MTNVNGIDFSSFQIHLSRGVHETPREGMCIMECVAYMAGEEHTDHPACADTLVTSFAIKLNDSSTSKQRKRLLPFVFRLAGSRKPELADTRCLMAFDHGVRKLLPYTCRKNGFNSAAVALESIPAIVDLDTLSFAARQLEDIRAMVRVADIDDEDFRVKNMVVRDLVRANFIDVSRAIGVFNSQWVRPDDEAFVKNVHHSVANSIFRITGQYTTHGLPQEEFDLHYELIDNLLKLTDEATIDAADTKLELLEIITKDHKIPVVA